MTSLIRPYIHSTCIYQCLPYARHCPSHWGTAQVTSLSASFICYTNFLRVPALAVKEETSAKIPALPDLTAAL